MRYDDWDVLLIDQANHTPLSEFRATCHVPTTTDTGNPLGFCSLPTVTAFVPSLYYGTPFGISVYNWGSPAINHTPNPYISQDELALFEIRVFIDGRMVSLTTLDHKTLWPVNIQQALVFGENGELEPLRFPAFREEVLHQSMWRPHDDLGRIKVVISKAFPRNSPELPLDRVRHLVVFSFQHAPIDLLESSAISWPSPTAYYGLPTTSITAPRYCSELAATQPEHYNTHHQDVATEHQSSNAKLISVTADRPSPAVEIQNGGRAQSALPQRTEDGNAFGSTHSDSITLCNNPQTDQFGSLQALYSSEGNAGGRGHAEDSITWTEMYDQDSVDAITNVIHEFYAHAQRSPGKGSSGPGLPCYASSHHNTHSQIASNATIHRSEFPQGCPQEAAPNSRPTALEMSNNAAAMKAAVNSNVQTAPTACDTSPQEIFSPTPFPGPLASHSEASLAQMYSIPPPTAKTRPKKGQQTQQTTFNQMATHISSAPTNPSDHPETRTISEPMIASVEEATSAVRSPSSNSLHQGCLPAAQVPQRQDFGRSVSTGIANGENQNPLIIDTSIKDVRNFTPPGVQGIMDSAGFLTSPLL